MIEQLQLFAPARKAAEVADDSVEVGSMRLPVHYKRNTRARHYLIYVRRDGTLRVTIPRFGNRGEAERFVREKTGWIERQWKKITAPGWAPKSWQAGTLVWWEGREVPLTVETVDGQEWIQVGPLRFPAKTRVSDLRPMVEEQMRVYAAKVLPPRTMEMAAKFDLEPLSVTVRNQSTRWGSCSHAGRLSLNWRLVQLPRAVCDYVIIHELMHLQELNHSKRFWNLVAKACPDYKSHETWLKTNAVKLGM